MADTNVLDLLLGQLQRGDVPPNDLDFRLGEWYQSAPEAGESAVEWVRRIIRQRFSEEQYAAQFPNDAELTNACRLLGQHALAFGDQSPEQQNRLEQLQQIPAHDLPAAANLLLDLRRGYSDAQVVARAALIEEERNAQLAAVRDSIRRTRQRLRTNAVRNARHLRSRHEENLNELIALRDRLAALNPHDAAASQLSEQIVANVTGGIPGVHSMGAAVRGAQIAYHDPIRVNFPLRFLRHLPLGIFYSLLDQWNGHNLGDLLDDLANTVLTSSFVETIIDRAQGGPFVIGAERVNILTELHSVVADGRWQSTGLIGVTQSEGLVWLFARHLTARGIRICRAVRVNGKTKYSPYRWDFQARDYRDRNPLTGRPRNQMQANNPNRPHTVLSARDLITSTALQCVFPIELWGFLVDEFYDERNPLAHGDLVVDARLATKAVLCLSEVIHTINDCEARRQRGGNWREPF